MSKEKKKKKPMWHKGISSPSHYNRKRSRQRGKQLRWVRGLDAEVTTQGL